MKKTPCIFKFLSLVFLHVFVDRFTKRAFSSHRLMQNAKKLQGREKEREIFCIFYKNKDLI